MVLSRSADYALRSMIYLARQNGPRFVTLTEIATAMKTPPFLLGRLLQQLVRGGLLHSMKGHHGGFRLRLSPDEVTAADVIRLIDGPFEVFGCAGHAECGLNDSCNLVEVFERAETALQSVFSAVTLSELAGPPRSARNNVVPTRSLDGVRVDMSGSR